MASRAPAACRRSASTTALQPVGSSPRILVYLVKPGTKHPWDRESGHHYGWSNCSVLWEGLQESHGEGVGHSWSKKHLCGYLLPLCPLASLPQRITDLLTMAGSLRLLQETRLAQHRATLGIWYYSFKDHESVFPITVSGGA